jgi:hypothetical protein
LEELERQAEEWWRSLSVSVCTSNEIDMCNNAIDDVCFVDGKTLIFPEVTIDYSLANWLFHDSGGIEAIWGERPSWASFVEEALLVRAVIRHADGRRGRDRRELAIWAMCRKELVDYLELSKNEDVSSWFEGWALMFCATNSSAEAYRAALTLIVELQLYQLKSLVKFLLIQQLPVQPQLANNFFFDCYSFI